MKIRYYLRGLGLGIVFASIFFLVGGDSGQTMSDEMIKERAKELGMIESTVLADIESTEEKTLEEESSTEESLTEEILSVEEKTSEEESFQEEIQSEEITEEEESITEDAITEESSIEENAEGENSAEEPQIVSIVVNRGEGSDTVSRRMYEAGLIEDAGVYDKYLMQNGYDRKIASGEHEIPMGADWEEMAKLLCSRQ